MSFEQLLHVGKLGHADFPHNLLVLEWHEKRQHLALYSQDLPRLAEVAKNAQKKPYELNPLITLVDPIPKLRLSSACEGAVNCLYGMAEIAAQFGNKASKGSLPASFNALRKKAEQGDLPDSRLSDWVSDFSWYKKIREIRTEWAHFSTVFIGQNNRGDPVLVVRCHRRHSDREEFRHEINVTIPDLVGWINSALAVVDNFGSYLLAHYIIPKLDMSRKFTTPKLDERGWPVVRPDHRFEVEQITVAQYLAQVGLRFDD